MPDRKARFQAADQQGDKRRRIATASLRTGLARTDLNRLTGVVSLSVKYHHVGPQHLAAGDLRRIGRGKLRPEDHRLPLTGKGHILPVAHIEPAPAPLVLHRGVQLHIAGKIVPDLGIDAQHRPQRHEPAGQKCPEPVLLRFVSHDVLFDLHSFTPHAFCPDSTTSHSPAQGPGRSTAVTCRYPP